jgi:hypothetical protein
MWKDIESYEGLYQVNEHGVVRSLVKWNGHRYVNREMPLIMAQSFTTTGYKKVELSKNGEKKSLRVHRLVALAFIPTVEGKPFINHKDGDPHNNNVSNLEWCNQQENVIHALETGLKKMHTVTKDELSALVEDGLQAKDIMKITHISYPRLKSFYKQYGVRNNHNKYQIDKNDLKQAIEDGLTNSEIAKKYKCPSSLIARRRYQIKEGLY